MKPIEKIQISGYDGKSVDYTRFRKEYMNEKNLKENKIENEKRDLARTQKAIKNEI